MNEQKALQIITAAAHSTHTSLDELAAIVFLLAKNQNNHAAVQHAVQQLLKADITTLPFATACHILAALHTHSPQTIRGEQLAYVTKTLITYEVSPGGPYTKNVAKKSVLKINDAIDTLFTTFKTPLPAVKRYLKNKAYTKSWPETSELTKACHAVVQNKPKSIHKHTIFSEFAKYDEPIKTTIAEYFTTVQTHSVFSEIETIAKQSSQALKKPLHLSQTHYKNLSYANIYFWLSYSLYDAILDADANAHTKLPIANIAHRQSLFYYKKPLNIAPRFKQNIALYYNKIDEANAWELANCRFIVQDAAITIGQLPNYKNNMHILANRALGHSIGPLIVAKLANANKNQYQHVYDGLCFYLIAKQLNDDLHDWKQDLARGHISYVVAMLLAQTNVTKGAYAYGELVTKLQRTFYKKTMQETCTTIITYSDRAHAALLQSGLYNANASFLELVQKPQQSAKQTLAIVNQQKDFIKYVKS